MKNKKALIGAGIGIVAGLLLCSYWKKRKETKATSGGSTKSGGGSGGSYAPPAGLPLSQAYVDPKTPATTVEDAKELADAALQKKPPPSPVAPPTTRPMIASPAKEVLPTSTRPISTTSTRPISTTTATASRFSGFQGGADYVEVGSELTDLD